MLTSWVTESESCTLPVMFSFYFVQVFKNAATEQQFNLEAAIKNVEKMSSELRKLNGNSHFIIQINKKLLKALFFKSMLVTVTWFFVSYNWVLI